MAFFGWLGVEVAVLVTHSHGLGRSCLYDYDVQHAYVRMDRWMYGCMDGRGDMY